MTEPRQAAARSGVKAAQRPQGLALRRMDRRLQYSAETIHQEPT